VRAGNRIECGGEFAFQKQRVAAAHQAGIKKFALLPGKRLHRFEMLDGAIGIMLRQFEFGCGIVGERRPRHSNPSAAARLSFRCGDVARIDHAFLYDFRFHGRVTALRRRRGPGEGISAGAERAPGAREGTCHAAAAGDHRALVRTRPLQSAKPSRLVCAVRRMPHHFIEPWSMRKST
jgi:hypothetical protein